ncbi:hypothetical protein XBKB1_1850003 [Xenorhabdus bovienii str. kraussei Becker Underwood]|uniref:Uncharacterized protein n=1 Tax=Xenorhabdus bovienii str. kraussei Becker Underwood TaxID=1398204 RepID=A0A077PUL8_XENBV|nr:hypothetical protein XBKB1_1850003 [Xenorhabdus bovienii str. kraussei Becker Underwood]
MYLILLADQKSQVCHFSLRFSLAIIKSLSMRVFGYAGKIEKDVQTRCLYDAL